MITLKAVGVDPVPNYTRDVGKGWARWDAYVYAPDPDSPAFEVVRRVTLAEYGDENALDRFARDVDAVTYEFENVPAEVATFLNSRRPVLPAPSVLAPARKTVRTDMATRPPR